MDILEIRELNEIPDPAPYDENPVETSDYLMTMLLRRRPALLHADFQADGGRWLIRPLGGPASADECVATSKSLAEFRSVLARFGYHYMKDQMYGGHCGRLVSQKRLKFKCEFFMSNTDWVGHWIRVYATPPQG